MSSSSCVRTLVVDDSAAIRASLSSWVDGYRGLEVIGTAENGREAVDKVRALTPDLVLMDLHMPEMNGLDATKEIRRRHPEVQVIVVTNHKGEALRTACRSAGADGFVSKTAGPREILNEIRRVVAPESSQTN